ATPRPATSTSQTRTHTTQQPTPSMAPTTSTAPAATPTTVPRSTTTTLICRDSTNPACGAFRWDPPPAPDHPLTVTVTYSPAHPPVAGPRTCHYVNVDRDHNRAQQWSHSGQIKRADAERP